MRSMHAGYMQLHNAHTLRIRTENALHVQLYMAHASVYIHVYSYLYARAMTFVHGSHLPTKPFWAAPLCVCATMVGHASKNQ